MKSILSVMIAGVLLGGTVFVDQAEAADRRRDSNHGRVRVEVRRDQRNDARYSRGRNDRYDRGRDDRYDRDRYDRGRNDRYFRGRDVVVIRDYYRPYYRPAPRGLRSSYYRAGYLPNGWARRIRPVPIYLERDFYPVPRGYRRGLIDGHAVVYNDRGFILDVAVLF